jgi:hypothetical protein
MVRFAQLSFASVGDPALTTIYPRTLHLADLITELNGKHTGLFYVNYYIF